MKRVAWFPFMLLLQMAAFPLYAQLPRAIDLVVQGHALPPQSYSLLVQDVDSGESLLAVNETLPLNPASTIKTLTTLAALETLGPAYTWTTKVYALGPVEQGVLQGDLLLQGGGDPYLLEEQFRNLLKALRMRGIERITGDLVIDANYFDASVRREPAIDNDAGRAYNVLPSALSLNFQAVTFYFSPKADGSGVDIRSDPALPNLHINNRLRLKQGACTGYQRGISFSYDKAAPNGVNFEGQFPSACKLFTLVRATDDPMAYAYGLFTALWRELGGEFTGTLRLGTAPANTQALLRWESPPLAEVIRYLNKYSNNLMARHLLLTLAAENGTVPATVNAGARVLTAYLSGLGLDVAGLDVQNGSGLSRATRLTTAQLAGALRQGYHSRYMAEYLSSLPVAGEDGTMRERLREDANRGYMHVKTGTLSEVSAVAGYVTGKSGRHYVVAGILNHADADRGPGVELTDALLSWARQQ
ncbi:MAG: D-alanyl-D-alanine carboxypeptidase/D-alanyl-D-alanine-endopeptidase [Pseudomonadales bacterium]|jgi:D-alanyl-D-alanine carboxypeptidase/D-alanyl-D-alanine-endopeptidase (penicillin-binding protein 4)|nr:D-alanyl-D-alanine carboxypeptidase/D-alanyl-D-alanine-endopeptidase [Pseudomonadales bacterium]